MPPHTHAQRLIRSPRIALLFVACWIPCQSLATPRIEDITDGPLRIRIEVNPGTVALDRDLVVSLAVTAPVTLDILLPELTDRFGGLNVNSSFDRDPVRRNDTITVQRRASLTPIIGNPYRIAPMAVGYRTRGSSEPWAWAVTRPIILERDPLIEGPASGTIQDAFEPRWIRPSATTFALIGLSVLGIIAIIVGIVFLLRHIRYQSRLRHMSPRERALEELRRLLLRKLIEKDRIKDFYVELTMVVRRYIERSHEVRAPEQTTEEFLNAVSSDTRFAPDIVAKLRTFLEAADLVKFAAHEPDRGAIDHSLQTARDYITTDSAPRPPNHQPPARSDCATSATGGSTINN